MAPKALSGNCRMEQGSVCARLQDEKRAETSTFSSQPLRHKWGSGIAKLHAIAVLLECQVRGRLVRGKVAFEDRWADISTS